MYLELAPCVSVVFIDTVICYSILAIKFIQGQRSPTTCTMKLACNLQLMIEVSLILIHVLAGTNFLAKFDSYYLNLFGG